AGGVVVGDGDVGVSERGGGGQDGIDLPGIRVSDIRLQRGTACRGNGDGRAVETRGVRKRGTLPVGTAQTTASDVNVRALRETRSRGERYVTGGAHDLARRDARSGGGDGGDGDQHRTTGKCVGGEHERLISEANAGHDDVRLISAGRS